jgi:serine protease Do
MKKPLRFLVFVVALIAVIAVGISFNDAVSQDKSGSPPKPIEKAAEDLKKDPPVNPAKLGDPLPRNLFVELAKTINPAVVSISTAQNVRVNPRFRGGYRDPIQEFLEEFYGGGGGGIPRSDGPQPQGLGTGFIISADGLIITNNHVIEAADIIRVSLDNNEQNFYEAEVVGRDPRTDIALIKIDAKKQLPVAPLGNSSTVQVGEWVAAFGNPYGHAHTMTKGIISAIGRELNEINKFPFLQTDASINPGNSGGPLVNSLGYVIGVNTAIDARAQGIGFAIPIDNVKTIIEQLKKEGRVRRGYIGIGLQPITPQLAQGLGLESLDGVMVASIDQNGNAAKAGVQLYDIITEINGKKIVTYTDVMNQVGDSEIGSKAKFKVLRIENDRLKEKTLNVTIGENAEQSAPKKDVRKYIGQKAPFELGFKVADFNSKVAQELGVAPGTPQGPIVIEVERGSVASGSGLHSGDVILDVNRQPARRATDVVRLLKKGQNVLRVARGGQVALVPMQVK